LNAPVSLVVAVRTVPRSTSLAVTLAPWTAAPLGSTTVPTIEPVTSCPDAAGVSSSIKTDKQRMRALAQNALEKLFFGKAIFSERQVDWRPGSEILMRSI